MTGYENNNQDHDARTEPALIVREEASLAVRYSQSDIVEMLNTRRFEMRRQNVEEQREKYQS